MAKSATDVMQEIIFSAVIDSIMALKASSKGMPNTLLRDLNAVHANTTFADLPAELQAAIGASVRAAFSRLLKEGYSVSGGDPKAPPRSPRPQGSPPPRPRHGDKRGEGPSGGKPGGGRGRPGGGGGGRPPRKPPQG